MGRTSFLCTRLLPTVWMLWAPVVFAQIPQTISYQGLLTDANGSIVADGNYSLTFKLYEVAHGGNPVWAEGQVIAVTKGIFNAILGSVSPLNLAFDRTYWLGVAVGLGAELAPRTELTSAAYSLNARSIADSAVTRDKIASGQVVKSVNSLTDEVMLAAGDNVTISVSGNTLTIASAAGGGGGDITAVNAGTGLTGGGASGDVTVSLAIPLSLNVSSSDAIIGGSNSGNGIGVRGESASGWGVFGSSNSHIGVGGANLNSGTYGLLGSSDYGVFGSSSTGSSIYGRNQSTENHGALGTTSHGAFGSSASGFGVYGTSSSGNGVHGHSISGYAGYFAGRVKAEGDVDILGTLSKGGGSFKIDHPLDPQNKYLYHSFVESPDMKNVYDGIATLDANGEAVVELPSYFQSLNSDYRYQLTCIGDYAPVYIAAEVTNNAFKIAGGRTGLKVSWQVTGIREDPFAKAHRIVAEVEKAAGERGKYLHPREYGAPEIMSIEYERIHAMEEQGLKKMATHPQSLRPEERASIAIGR